MNWRHRIVLVAVFAALLPACAALDNRGGDDLVRMQREAQAAFDNGDDARAEVLFKALARSIPNDAETWLRLGNLYARTNNPDQAVDAYMKSLALNSNDARAWNNLGIVRLRQAWAAMIRANRLADPKDPAYATSSEIVKSLEQIPSIADLKAQKPVPAPPKPGAAK